MDASSQFIVPTIIDVPELIVTNEDVDFDDSSVIIGRAWLNKLQFIASTLGYSIGLSNIWRFPYLCYKHGGGAFIAVYTFILIAIGFPLLLMELAFGQYANEGPITIWRISPAFEGIGYAMCLISAAVAIYYNIINTWIVHYLLASLSVGQLPWTSCDNKWNSPQCFLRSDSPNISSVDCNSSSSMTSISNSSSRGSIFDPSTSLNGSSKVNCTSKFNSSSEFHYERIINSSDEVFLPANEYFHNNVVAISESLTQIGSLNLNAVMGLVLVWSLVFLVILKDIRIHNRIFSLATVFMPYLALATLFVRAITLPGSAIGISYYLNAEWEKLQKIDIWADATTQIFFALSPCWGGIITLASMNKFHNSFQADAMLIVTINYLTSIFSGLVSFAILGYMSTYSGIAIANLVEVGPGFVFMVYTEALAQLPLAHLNSLVFFGVLLYLGFNTELTVIETVMSTIVDTWPHKLRYRKPLILMILCAVMFIISLCTCFANGFFLVQLMDQFAGSFNAMAVAILELIAIAWVYGIENFMQDIDDMISVHRNLFPSRSHWCFMWRYFSPSLLFAILLFSFTDLKPATYRNVEQPEWTLKIGWTLTIVCVSIIAGVAFVRFLLSPGGSFYDKVAYLCRPSEDWAPSSYVSGPKLLNRHMMEDRDYDRARTVYSSPHSSQAYDDHDQESNESNEDLKVVNGRANYIIPEEEEDTDTGFITNETNV